MIIAFTFGFDERFAIRALVRHQVGGEDKVVVITPKDRLDQRAENALNSLSDFVKKYLSGPGVVVVDVEVSDFTKAIIELVRVYRSWTTRPIILNLSGGMRALILESIVAAIMSGIDMKIEVEGEDGSFVTDFDVSVVNLAEIDLLERTILKVISQVETSITKLAKITELSRSTVWRKVRRLTRLNLVELSDRVSPGEKSKLKITNKGRLILSIYDEEHNQS